MARLRFTDKFPNLLAILLVFDPSEQFCAEPSNRFRLIGRQFVVDLPALVSPRTRELEIAGQLLTGTRLCNIVRETWRLVPQILEIYKTT